MTERIPFAGYLVVPNRLCIICIHIFDGSAAPKTVVHERDGSWQVVCERGHGSAKDFKVVGFGHVAPLLPTHEELPHLPPGHLAEETDDGRWVVNDYPEEEEC
ncbi:MAG: hypothetical protein AAGD34_17545 [Pseudomonadota bacterium]